MKARFFIISIDSCYLNTFSSSRPHLSLTLDRSKVLSQIYEILGFFKFFISFTLTAKDFSHPDLLKIFS